MDNEISENTTNQFWVNISEDRISPYFELLIYKSPTQLWREESRKGFRFA